jgi:hypothetical protein
MDGWTEIISSFDKHPSLCIGLASLISALVSTVIAGGFGLFTAILTRRSEKLRARSDIAVRIGLEAFKHTIEVSKSMSGNIGLMPPEFWILSSVKLAELLSMENINAEEAKTKIGEAIKFNEEIAKIIK